MKKLLLIRHAKSSWKNPDLEDKDRPLNKRGNIDAPLMAQMLKNENILPDLIISSPALRSATTANIFAEILDYKTTNILINKRLYEPDIDDFLHVLQKVDDTVSTLFLFSHNPGITHFSNWVSDKRIDNIPTCGIVTMKINVKSWKDVDFDNGTILSFDSPKKYKTN